jgi:hypothetical protein
MHVDPAQVPTDLKEPAMDAGYPPDRRGTDGETDCPEDVTTPGWPDRYRAWTIQEMRRNGWSTEGLARVFGLTPFGVELYLRKETRA